MSGYLNNGMAAYVSGGSRERPAVRRNLLAEFNNAVNEEPANKTGETVKENVRNLTDAIGRIRIAN